MNDRTIDPGNIARACSVIDAQFTGTPQFVTPVAGTASRLLLKVETVNPLRCLKGRGTEYLLAAMHGCEPLACASAGNFGQALALWAARRDLPVHVFTASTVDPFKAARMRGLGAEVHSRTKTSTARRSRPDSARANRAGCLWRTEATRASPRAQARSRPRWRLRRAGQMPSSRPSATAA